MLEKRICQASQNSADTVVNSHKLPLCLSSFLLSTLPPRPLAVCVALREENFRLLRAWKSIILEVALRVSRAEREVVEWQLKFNVDGETGEARKALLHVRVCAAFSSLFPTTPFERRVQSFQATATMESGRGMLGVDIPRRKSPDNTQTMTKAGHRGQSVRLMQRPQKTENYSNLPPHPLFVIDHHLTWVK
ncbi:hypothetical protein BLNAU_8019 [Blattamonas nauphoetae]|uniref:Uncharacterized protein n=1 Tax=Blattamonas nauphoetae TaxID=2049346 RepID=A0ABQ9XZQ5_9EUKA|nr:hypothetical protein BLNAU_8019 [Blattamonas nauphoetae]